MKVLLSGIILGLLLLAVPFYIDYRYRLKIGEKMLLVFGRAIVVMALVALVVYGG